MNVSKPARSRARSAHDDLQEREKRLIRILDGRIGRFDDETSRLVTELCETAVARAAIARFRAETSGKRRGVAVATPVSIPRQGTIAETIVTVLRGIPQGARASRITALMAGWPSTSVRPHLSRLHRKGVLWHENGTWGLIPGADEAGVPDGGPPFYGRVETVARETTE